MFLKNALLVEDGFPNNSGVMLFKQIQPAQTLPNKPFAVLLPWFNPRPKPPSTLFYSRPLDVQHCSRIRG